MIREKISSNRGITIISLVVTVILLLMLTGAGIYSINMSNNRAYYNKMVADINLLNDKVLVYYNKYNEIPKTSRIDALTIVDILYLGVARNEFKQTKEYIKSTREAINSIK